MTTVAALLVASTGLYAGFQWTIRVVVYPQFATVSADTFVRYEREHQRRVTIAVGPLFAFFGLSAVAAVVREPGPASFVVAGCYLLILAATGFGAVSQHRRLTAGFDAAAHRRLLLVDSGRLVLAVSALAVAVIHALA